MADNEDKIGGLTVSEPDEITGGLAISTETDVEGVKKEQSEFDPVTLLDMEGMGVDQFYSLDSDKVYNTVRRLVVHRDPEVVAKAERILSLVEKGKEGFLKENPDSKEIKF